MARKPEIQYVRYYTDGSAARQLEPKRAPHRKKQAVHRPYKEKKKLVYIDPLAIGGILVSAVMLVLMMVGISQYLTLRQQTVQMQRYVSQLEQENAVLTDTYEAGIDLESIEKSALALGMIPQEQAQHIIISVSGNDPVAEPDFWEQVAAFFRGIFA